MIINFISKILNSIGWGLYRKLRPRCPRFSANQRPLYIELLGVSGVGKSTIFQTSLKSSATFWTLTDFKSQSKIKDLNYLADQEEFYQKLAIAQWKYISEKKILPADRFRIAHWNYKTLLDDLLIKKYNHNAVVFSDEGLLHNFQDSILEIHYQNPEALKSLLEDRAIIYCFTTPETVVRQILDRQAKTGRVIVYHKGKSETELLNLVEVELKNKDQFLTILERYNVPILKIDTQLSTTEIQEKITKFIQFHSL